MFTVVIAEKTHISSMQNFGILLKPYMKDTIAFCEWIPEGNTLVESVPDLEKTVSHQKIWRALIICDEAGLHNRNPFDLVPFDKPVRPQYAEEIPAYLAQLRAAKCTAYDMAAQKPLVKLLTKICEAPLVAEGRNKQAKEDPEFEEYQYEIQYKNQLRRKICGDEKLNIFYPTEILCVAMRTYEEQEYAIRSAWAPHDVNQYRRFYDWNLYFDKQRYLVYDILPCEHKNYISDYLRFLAVILLLAGNDVPPDSLRPNQVYVVCGESESETLRQLLTEYDKKLCVTNEEIEKSARQLLSKKEKRLNDDEVEAFFNAKNNIAVILENRPDAEALYAQTDEFGLTTDVPVDERQIWAREYKESVKSLEKLIKQVPRGLRRAEDALRLSAHCDELTCSRLTDFQLEDVADNIHNEEMAMIRLFSNNGYEPEKYRQELERAREKVSRKLDTRVTRKQIFSISAVAAAMLLIGFLPLFVNGFRNKEGSQIFAAFLMFLGTFAAMAAIGIICLFFLRRALKKKVCDFNDIVKDIHDKTYASAQQFSAYLGHLCNAMRGFSALNFLSGYEPKEQRQVRIYRKHQADIMMQRSQLRELFGDELPSGLDVFCEDAEPYNYDFDRPLEYEYPLPSQQGKLNQIEFLKNGNMVPVDVMFIQRVSLRLEEYYD